MLANLDSATNETTSLSVIWSSAESRITGVCWKKDGRKVIEGAGWQDVQEVPVQKGKVPIQKWDGKVKNVGGGIQKFVPDLTCPSYFARDELAKFFK